MLLFDYFIAALAVASVSITITKSILFKSLRDRIDLAFFKKLFNCPYCLAHWIAFPLIFKFGLIGIFGLIGLSHVLSIPILFYLEHLDEAVHDSSRRTL